MHKNSYWLLFIIAITLCVSWYTWKSVSQLREYLALSRKAQSVQINWFTEERDTNEYILIADYTFEANGSTYHGKEHFQRPLYGTPAAAKRAITYHMGEKWNVWYSENDPNHSTLIKYFPFKQLAYTILLWGLLIYFYWLGFSVNRYKT